MTSMQTPGLLGGRDGDAVTPVGQRARRREEFEALGLLLGVLGVLLVLALTLGLAPPLLA